MKLSQIKEMLSKISPWPWYPVIYHNESEPEADARIWTVGPNEDEPGWYNDADCEGYGLLKEDAVFMAAAPTIIDQLIRQNEVMREALHKIEGENWREPDSTYTIKIINEAIQEVERIEDEHN